ncbi:MAG: lytic polysaccharide monooxygenase [Myxococcaceae bacterium]|nr:lytic polysaccharide monooxygenase [Myxococcaceae bacterium]
MTTLVIMGTAASAQAHARLVAPQPRTNDADLKDGNGGAPCGGKARNPARVATYTMGQTVQVRWEETINHAGCFIIKVSAANDSNFVMVANPPHSTTGALPRPYTANVTLPAGMTCSACTMQLIQVMNNTVPCPTTNIPAGDSYYSCADIVILAPDAGMGGTAGGGSGGSAGGGMTATAGGMASATAGGGMTAGPAGGGEAPGDTGTAGGAEVAAVLEGGQFAEGGCSATGALGAFGLLALAVVARRRRA